MARARAAGPRRTGSRAVQNGSRHAPGSAARRVAPQRVEQSWVAAPALDPAFAGRGPALPGGLGAAARVPLPAARPAAGRGASVPAAGMAVPAPGPLLPRTRAVCGSLIDGLLRGPAWVVCLGVLLAGIVFLNVGLLRLNADIARMDGRAEALKRDNAGLRADVARLGSTERIQRQAAERGLVHPPPGKVNYLRADPARDGERAVRTMRAPASRVPPVASGAAVGAGGTSGVLAPTQAPAAPVPGPATTAEPAAPAAAPAPQPPTGAPAPQSGATVAP